MTKLKLQPIGSEDKRAGKYQVTLDPLLNADLQLYIEAYRSAYPAAEAAKAREDHRGDGPAVHRIRFDLYPSQARTGKNYSLIANQFAGIAPLVMYAHSVQ